uniref:Uncharacterized protein n=1 Tax=viral metagenome TaxID=1070528 RepID=A0A6C0IS73_9ZZZZ
MRLEPELYKNLSNISYALLVAGFIIVIVTTGITNQNSLAALISGYATLLVSLLFILWLNWINMENIPLFTLIKNIFPFLTIMTLLILLITFLSVYFDRIASDHVSTYYYTFSNLSTLFLIIQLIILFRELGTKSFEVTKIISPKIFSMLMLLTTINAIIVGTLGMILKFYITQG